VSEHRLQNDIRNALAGLCLLWRANVGTAWAGTGKPFRASRPMVVSLKPGDMVLRQARPFSTGLPEGFADTFGLVQVKVTPDMVGQTLAVFLAGEIKDVEGVLSPQQKLFLRAVQANGGRAGVWRSVEDALATVQGRPTAAARATISK
jgi:hypothetical protein